MEKIRIVAALHKREKATAGCANPTDEEVVAAVEVSYHLIDVGNVLGLEMLSCWAVARYSHYHGIAFHRGIQNQIKLVPEAKIDVESTTSSVSAHWVLNQLAGMSFINKSGKDAYDYMKESMFVSGIKTP